nr:hypothetical protein [Tanacetum cinerariifolium]
MSPVENRERYRFQTSRILLRSWVYTLPMQKFTQWLGKHIVMKHGPHLHNKDEKRMSLVTQTKLPIVMQLVLFRHLQEKLNGIETKLKKSQYQLAA